MKSYTVCAIINPADRTILLKKANRGVSIGLWNSPGGHIEPGETPEACAIREVKEETNLTPRSVFYHGKISEKFSDGFEAEFYLYSTHSWLGFTFVGGENPSGEGKLEWFSFDKIPFTEMWAEDAIWLPMILFNSNIRFDMSLRYNGRQLLEATITKIVDYP